MSACWARLRVELHYSIGPIEDKVVVLGSGAMQLQGIEREIKDIDLFVRPDHWEELYDTGRWRIVPDLDPPPMLQWDGCALPVHAWKESYTRFIDNDSSVETTFQRARIVNGWPVMDLQQLMDWKLEADRPKDRIDVDLIAAHLLKTGVRD